LGAEMREEENEKDESPRESGRVSIHPDNWYGTGTHSPKSQGTGTPARAP